MPALPQRHWLTLTFLFAVIMGIIMLTVRQYNGNVSAFFHVDQRFHRSNPVPENFVVLDVPAYDGAQYYQLARSMPLIAQLSRWGELKDRLPGAYGYQRILLPALAALVSFGWEAALPYTFLLLNTAGILLAAALLLHHTKKPLYALALGLCPAALIGLHFSLAEPITLALITLFLVRFLSSGRLRPADAAILSMVVLAREVNVLFIGFLIMYLLLSRRWMEAAWSLLPLAVFAAWHGIIFAIFDQIPFLVSTGKSTFPFLTPLLLLAGGYGYNLYTASSIFLLLGFVLPAFLWMTTTALRTKEHSFLLLGSMTFLLIMLAMPDVIWSSITSIGRVITPTYPLFLFWAASRDTVIARILALNLVVIGLLAGIGLALIVHPFSIT